MTVLTVDETKQILDRVSSGDYVVQVEQVHPSGESGRNYWVSASDDRYGFLVGETARACVVGEIQEPIGSDVVTWLSRVGLMGFTATVTLGETADVELKNLLEDK